MKEVGDVGSGEGGRVDDGVVVLHGGRAAEREWVVQVGGLGWDVIRHLLVVGRHMGVVLARRHDVRVVDSVVPRVGVALRGGAVGVAAARDGAAHVAPHHLPVMLLGVEEALVARMHPGLPHDRVVAHAVHSVDESMLVVLVLRVGLVGRGVVLSDCLRLRLLRRGVGRHGVHGLRSPLVNTSTTLSGNFSHSSLSSSFPLRRQFCGSLWSGLGRRAGIRGRPV